MKITTFGTYNVNTTPRVQTLIDGLLDNKIEVNECNVPLQVNTAERVKIAKQPWRLPLFGLKIISCWLRLIVKRWRTQAAHYILVGYLGQFDVLLARILFPRRTIILDYLTSGAATARDRKVSGGFKDKLLIWLDNAALRASNIVIVDTQEHLQDLPKAYRHKGVVVFVGAPNSWFDAALVPDKPSEQPLKVLFFGLYTPLQSTVTIAKAITKLKQPVEITMAGTGQDYEATRKIARSAAKTTKIHWIDWANLPQLAGHDVCLGVFGSGPKALKVVPNKAYQGAALGCMLITSNTAPQKHVLKQGALFVPVENPDALAEILDSLAKDPKEVLRLRKASYEYACQHFTPQKVVAPLLDKLS